MIDPGRITKLNDKPDRMGSWVLCWMQASQRAACNHALELAIAEANRRDVPCVACFGLTGGYPEANARHYRFMLEGLAETRAIACPLFEVDADAIVPVRVASDKEEYAAATLRSRLRSRSNARTAAALPRFSRNSSSGANWQ